MSESLLSLQYVGAVKEKHFWQQQPPAAIFGQTFSRMALWPTSKVFYEANPFLSMLCVQSFTTFDTRDELWSVLGANVPKTEMFSAVRDSNDFNLLMTLGIDMTENILVSATGAKLVVDALVKTGKTPVKENLETVQKYLADLVVTDRNLIEQLRPSVEEQMKRLSVRPTQTQPQQPGDDEMIAVSRNELGMVFASLIDLNTQSQAMKQTLVRLNRERFAQSVREQCAGAPSAKRVKTEDGEMESTIGENIINVVSGALNSVDLKEEGNLVKGCEIVVSSLLGVLSPKQTIPFIDFLKKLVEDYA